MHIHLDVALPPLEAISGWCGAPAWPIPILLFVTGLVGGLAHCGPMCGPFVLTQAAAVPVDLPVLRRLAGGLLLPYHCGRLVTYGVLGAVAARLGAAIVATAPVRLALAALLLIAAAAFAIQAAFRFGIGFAVPPRPGGVGSIASAAIVRSWAGGLARLSQSLLDNPSPARRFVLGTVLGLLPCGFLYGALAAAAAIRHPAGGALAMAAFGLGTVPSLFAVGIGGASLAA